MRPVAILTFVGLTVGGEIALIEGCGLEVTGGIVPEGEGGASSSGTTSGSIDPPVASGDGSPGIDGAVERDAGADADDPDGGPCPSTCNTCNAQGVCVITCTGPNACKDDVILCPASRPCLVLCDGKSSCSGTSVTCPPTALCGVDCNGDDACKGILVNSGQSGQSCVVCHDNPGAATACSEITCSSTVSSTCELRCEDGGCGPTPSCSCKDAVCP